VSTTVPTRLRPSQTSCLKDPGVARGYRALTRKALTDDEAAALRQRIAAGEKKAQVARELSISRETL
jgi:hypothetical protein